MMYGLHRCLGAQSQSEQILQKLSVFPVHFKSKTRVSPYTIPSPGIAHQLKLLTPIKINVPTFN